VARRERPNDRPRRRFGIVRIGSAVTASEIPVLLEWVAVRVGPRQLRGALIEGVLTLLRDVLLAGYCPRFSFERRYHTVFVTIVCIFDCLVDCRHDLFEVRFVAENVPAGALPILERLAADEATHNEAIAGIGTARRLPLQVIATRGAHDSALRKADPRQTQ
jgi:hypothetical protein